MIVALMYRDIRTQMSLVEGIHHATWLTEDNRPGDDVPARFNEPDGFYVEVG
jgi:hypothetical protein